MATGFEWAGFQRFDSGLQALTEFDAYPLMEQWCAIEQEGNRRAVLSGLDGYNRPAPPLVYRFGIGKKTKNRRVPLFGTTLHQSGGDALTRAEYEELGGPRLAPRGDASHIIKNLHQEVRHFAAENRWEAVCAWEAFLDKNGNDIFTYHFLGQGHNPRYDLRPVRPEDIQFCENALRAFVKQEYLSRF